MSDPTTNNPVSQDDTEVTQRLSALSGVLEELKAEVGETSVQPSQPEQPAAAPTPAPEPKSGALSETLAFETGKDDEDDSIESYMAALLERSNGFSSPGTSSDSAAPTAPPKAAQSAVPTPAAQQDTNATLNGDVTASSTVRLTPEELEERRRQTTIEVRNSMPSLRKLAKDSTKNAIDEHDCREISKHVYLQVGTAIVALTVSFFLLKITTYVPSTTFTCAILCSTIGIGCAIFFLRSVSRLQQMLTDHEAHRENEEMPLQSEQPL